MAKYLRKAMKKLQARRQNYDQFPPRTARLQV